MWGNDIRRGIGEVQDSLDWMRRVARTICWLDAVQVGLDAAGLLPGYGAVFDTANALIYLARGDQLNATISLIAAVPFLFEGASLLRYTDELAALGRYGDEANLSNNIRRAGGLRRSPLVQLDSEQIARLKQEFMEIGGDPAILRFNTGRQTGYIDGKRVINVRGDVLPLEGSNHPRSTMSTRAVLAHELGHANYDGTKLPPGAWNDEFRASYWAAKNSPALSIDERIDLVNDAITRAREAGIPIRYNSFMRRILYGIDE